MFWILTFFGQEIILFQGIGSAFSQNFVQKEVEE